MRYDILFSIEAKCRIRLVWEYLGLQKIIKGTENHAGQVRKPPFYSLFGEKFCSFDCLIYSF
jgi:hypothetical protein